MKCEKKEEKNDFVIPLTTRFTLGWVSCFLGNIAASEMRGGICLILHADLRFGITLEIVMLGFQAVALSFFPFHSKYTALPYYVFIGRGAALTILIWDMVQHKPLVFNCDDSYYIYYHMRNYKYFSIFI